MPTDGGLVPMPDEQLRKDAIKELERQQREAREKQERDRAK